jgi:hypothetical protein
VGRLPAKQTTRHVAKPERPEGFVTNDGRIKVVDNQTGRKKYIDAKIGMVLDNGGDITHERY